MPASEHGGHSRRFLSSHNAGMNSILELGTQSYPKLAADYGMILKGQVEGMSDLYLIDPPSRATWKI